MNRKSWPVSARRLLLIIALPFASIGCEKLSNKKDDLTLTCGPDFKLSKSGKYIQFRNEDLELLDSNSVASIQSLVITEGKSTELRVSSRGCVAYDGDEVIARTSINGKMFSAVVVKNEESSEKILAKLTEIKSSYFNFNCPAKGIIAGNTVTIPLVIESNSIQNISYEIYARSLKNKKLTKLAKKPFGSLSTTLVNLDITSLPIDEYAIEVYQSSMQGDSPNNFEFVHFEQTCNFQKIANIEFIPSNFNNQIVGKGEEIPIPTIENGEYESCAEAITEEPLSNSCLPRSGCTDPNAFTRVKKLVAESPGYFKYFYKSVDQIGRLSNLACTSVIVSDSAPKIELRWSDLKLANPNSLLSDFSPIIQANVNITHSILAEKDLDLQCRGVFKLATGESISASSVKCASGTCKGSDLAQFVPCAGKIDLDFRSVYSRTELSKSIFELEATSSDGARHSTTEKISFWLDRSKIKMKVSLDTPLEKSVTVIQDPVKYFGSDSSNFALLMSIRNSETNSNANIFKIFSKGKSFQYSQFSEEFPILVQVVNDPSGNIFVIWAKTNDESIPDTYNGCIATQVKGTQLQKIEPISLEKCGPLTFWSDANNGIWYSLLHTDDSKEMFNYSDEGSTNFLLAGNTVDPSCNISWSSVVNRQLYFLCDSVYVTPVELLNPKKAFELNHSFNDFKLEDEHGKIWFISRDPEKKSGYALNGAFYDLTAEILEVLSTQDTATLVHGEVVINGKIWNDQKHAFSDLRPEIRKISPKDNIFFSNHSYPVSCNSKGATVFGPEGAVFWPLAELLSERSEWPLSCKDLRTQDLKSITVTSRTAALIEFRNESWIRLGETQYPYEGRAPIVYVNQFKNLLTVLHTDGEVLQLQNNKWIPLERTFPKGLNSTQFYFSYILNNQYLAILQDGTLYLSRDGISWETAVQDQSMFMVGLPTYIQAADDGKVFYVVGYDKIYSWHNGDIHLEYEIDNIAQTSISECRGDVWMITNTRKSENKSIILSRYNSNLKKNQNFEIKGDFKEGTVAMRMQCLDEKRILIKMNEPGNSNIKDYVYSTATNSGHFLVNKQGKTFFTDFYWKEKAKVFVREDKIYDYDFKEIDSSALAGFNTNVTEYFHMAYRDAWDRIWYYSANSIGLIDLER